MDSERPLIDFNSFAEAIIREGQKKDARRQRVTSIPSRLVNRALKRLDMHDHPDFRWPDEERYASYYGVQSSIDSAYTDMKVVLKSRAEGVSIEASYKAAQKKVPEEIRWIVTTYSGYVDSVAHDLAEIAYERGLERADEIEEIVGYSASDVEGLDYEERNLRAWELYNQLNSTNMTVRMGEDVN